MLTPADLKNIKHLFDDKFDQIDSRFDQIDDRFSQIDDRFSQIDARFEQVDGRLGHIDNRLDRIDNRLDKHDRQFEAVRGDIDALAQATKEQFDVVLERLDTLHDDVAVIKDIVKDHSFRLSRLEHHTFGPAT
jgi:archaellum component FlaC